MRANTERTPIAKNKVRARLPSHAAVNGSRSLEVMCFRCASGPASIANLAAEVGVNRETFGTCRTRLSPHPNINNKLPILKATANFLGLMASIGIVKKATKKHTAAPAQHSRKPRNRSHLDNAKYASSSFVLSFDLSGIYPERPSVFERRANGFDDASAAPDDVGAAAAESSVRPLAHRKLCCVFMKDSVSLVFI